MEVALGYLTGAPPTALTHAANFGANLIPGLGEARTARKAYRVGSIVNRLGRIASLPGGSKLYGQLQKHTNGLLSALKSGDRSYLDRQLATWVGEVYEARLAALFSSTVQGLGMRRGELSRMFGISEGSIANMMKRTRGNLEIDMVRREGNGYVLGQAKAADYSGVQGLGGWNKGAKQFLDTLDLAAGLQGAGHSTSVEYFIQGGVSQGLMEDMIQRALDEGVNLTIRIVR